jgi:hypothetical protein
MPSLRDFKKKLPKGYSVKEWRVLRQLHPAWYCGMSLIVSVANDKKEVRLVPAGDCRIYYGGQKFEYTDGNTQGTLSAELLRRGVFDSYNWIEVREVKDGKESCMKVAYTIEDALEMMLAIL